MDFVFRHVDLHPAQSVDHFDQSVKSHGNILRDIHVEIPVEHVERLFGAALRVSRVGLIVFIIAQVQISIPVNGAKLHIAGVLVDGSDHNRIRPLSLAQLSFPGIHRKQGDIAVALHLRILFHLFVENDIFRIDVDLFHFPDGADCHNHSHQRYQCDQLCRKQDDPAPLLCLSLSG